MQNDVISGTKRPNRWAIVLGHVLQRICPHGKKGECPDTSCKLKQFCKCAIEAQRIERGQENRLWLIVTACGVAAILIAWMMWR